MTQPNFLELAKQGDPQAIAILMNRSLQPFGITASTALQGDHLDVTLESEQVPDREAMTTFVRNGLVNLGVQSIHSVKIMGQHIGADSPVWVQDVNLEAPVATVSETPIVVTARPTPPPPPPHPVTPPPPPPTSGIPTSNGADLFDDDLDDLDITLPTSTARSNGMGVAATENDALLSSYDDLFEGDRSSAPNAEQWDDDDELTQDLSPSGYNFSKQPDAEDEIAMDEFLDLDLDDQPLRGTFALENPDDELEERDDDGDGIPNYLDPDFYDDDGEPIRGSFHLENPDDELEERDDDGDGIPNFLDPDFYDDDGEPIRGSFHLENPDDELEERDDDGDGIPNFLDPDFYDDDGEEPNQGRAVGLAAVPMADVSDGEAPPLDDRPVDEEDDLEAPEEHRSRTPAWVPLVILLVIGWIAALVAYAIWSSKNNPDTPVPVASPDSPTVSPAASPTTDPPVAVPPTTGVPSPSPTAAASPPTSPSPTAVASPASPPASPSPVQASPTIPASPATRPNPVVAVDAPPGPPAIACRPQQTTGAVSLSNLAFDRTVTGADGDYVVGCLTNNTDQAIADITINFQGNSARNTAINQAGSTKLTFSNLQPGQAVPFRSQFTVNPEVTTLQIQRISWTATGSNQSRDEQARVTLTR